MWRFIIAVLQEMEHEEAEEDMPLVEGWNKASATGAYKVYQEMIQRQVEEEEAQYAAQVASMEAAAVAAANAAAGWAHTSGFTSEDEESTFRPPAGRGRGRGGYGRGAGRGASGASSSAAAASYFGYPGEPAANWASPPERLTKFGRTVKPGRYQEQFYVPSADFYLNEPGFEAAAAAAAAAPATHKRMVRLGAVEGGAEEPSSIPRPPKRQRVSAADSDVSSAFHVHPDTLHRPWDSSADSALCNSVTSATFAAGSNLPLKQATWNSIAKNLQPSSYAAACQQRYAELLAAHAPARGAHLPTSFCFRGHRLPGAARPLREVSLTLTLPLTLTPCFFYFSLVCALSWNRSSAVRWLTSTSRTPFLAGGVLLQELRQQLSAVYSSMPDGLRETLAQATAGQPGDALQGVREELARVADVAAQVRAMT